MTSLKNIRNKYTQIHIFLKTCMFLRQKSQNLLVLHFLRLFLVLLLPLFGLEASIEVASHGESRRLHMHLLTLEVGAVQQLAGKVNRLHLK
jgi:hypothetical protein